MPHSHSASTRTLPAKPSLAQLRKQAKELLKAYRAREQAAVAEVEKFELSADSASFSLADAQRVLARAHGYPSWARFKQHVDGLNYGAFVKAADTGDIAAVRKLAKARPELIQPDLAEFSDSPMHRAVFNRDVEMVKALMQLGAHARIGIWPHRDATSAYTIAKERQYDEIVAAIEREEERRRQALSSTEAATDSRTDHILAAIRQRRSDEAIRIVQSDLALVRGCDITGATPLHLAAGMHDRQVVAWLLAHKAPVDTRDIEGKSPCDYAATSAGWPAHGRQFPYLVNAQIDPACFAEVVQLLRSHGALLTPRSAIAIGDREAVMQMHRDGQLKNDIDFWSGGLLTIAVKVNRIDMVSLLLEFEFDPDERAATTEDGGESWGFPLWFAAACGRHEIAKLLITRGADVNAIVYASGDPLSCALLTDDKRMESLLLQHGARITVEHIRAGDTETAQAILDGKIPGHSLNVADPSPTDLARQMLWAAAHNGDTGIIRLCLPRVGLNRDDPFWNYVLVHAASPEIVQLILEHGVEPDVVARDYTILHHVASDYVRDENRVPFARLLLDAGASLDKRDQTLKSTPLGWACRWGRVDLVRLYMERGVDPHEATAEVWATPMAWATKGGHRTIIELLDSRAGEQQ